LFRSAAGTRLHIRGCPHTGESDLTVATERDRDRLPVCAWCRAELDGEGRTYFDSLEEALDFFGAPKHAKAELAHLLLAVTHDGVYVPYSRSYVAVLQDGAVAAWAGKTYVEYADDRPMVTLPDYAPGGGGAGVDAQGTWGELCTRCYQVRSINGACGCM
jgi:hypothetical protein